MAAQREALFQALFTRLEALGTPGDQVFKFTSRVWQSWDDTPPTQCPAMFMIKGSEEALPSPIGAPPLWRLSAKVVIYVDNNEGRLVAPSTALNEILTAIEEALQRQPTEPPLTSGVPLFPSPMPGAFCTTLGGLCFSCQIAGQVEIFEGFIGGEAMAIVAIDMLTSA